MYNHVATVLPEPIFQLLFATLLGLFLGLEREWSDKEAGIRTFALLSLSGTILTISTPPIVLAAGFLVLAVLAALLGHEAALEANHEGLALTTSVSLVIAYGLGILAGNARYIEAVTVAVLAALLLVLKRDLHTFAADLRKDEIRSAAEFSILAFVVYPLLPSEPFGPWDAIDAQLVWLLVIAVSGIGFFNYIVVRKYEERGFWVTGFFGGLVNSTAVIVSLARRAKENPGVEDLTVTSILLANAAMALRNAAIVIAFIPALAMDVGLPLAAISIAGIGLAYTTRGTTATDFEMDLESPFSLKNALVFGGVFLGLLVLSAGANYVFGGAGVLSTVFLGGLVSSGSSTTTAVTLLYTEQITPVLAAYAVLVGTVASILVKLVFISMVSRDLIKPVAGLSAVLILSGVFGAGVVTVL